MIRIAFVVLFAICLAACQGEEAVEYYGTLTESPSGLVLERSEHAYGWGRANCWECHALENIHLPLPERPANLDMDAIRAIVDEEGLSSCVRCHGANGVNP